MGNRVKEMKKSHLISTDDLKLNAARSFSEHAKPNQILMEKDDEISVGAGEIKFFKQTARERPKEFGIYIAVGIFALAAIFLGCKFEAS